MHKIVSALLFLVALSVGSTRPSLADDDPQQVAASYGDLSVFILNVAAGNDGVTYQPEREQAFRDAFAEQVGTIYTGLGQEDQQSLAELAALDLALHQAWPTLPMDQRVAVRDVWADQVQAMLVDVSCDQYDALARARLVPSSPVYHDANLSRLLQCWQEYPELAKDTQGNSLPVRRGGGVGSHAAFVGLMNANMMNFAAGMNIASNIGGGKTTFYVK